MSENFFKKLKITDEAWNKVKVANVGVRPNSKNAYSTGLNAEQTKEIFDKGPELIKDQFNKLVDYAFEEEGKRISAEAERQNQEEQRQTAESERQTAESERQTAESERNNAENNRDVGENLRILGENQRVEAEGERIKAENERIASEDERDVNEFGRIEAELNRANAEQTRIANETERQNQEKEREEAATAREESFSYLAEPYKVPIRDEHGNIPIDDDESNIENRKAVAVSGLAVYLYVKGLFDALVNGAPGTMDTLKEIADLIGSGDDAATILGRIAKNAKSISDLDTLIAEHEGEIAEAEADIEDLSAIVASIKKFCDDLIAQIPGDSESKVMSQKATTEYVKDYVPKVATRNLANLTFENALLSGTTGVYTSLTTGANNAASPDYIEVVGGETYTYSYPYSEDVVKPYTYIHMYDSEKVWIGKFEFSSPAVGYKTITVDASCKYVRFSYYKSGFTWEECVPDKIQFELGNVATEYVLPELISPDVLPSEALKRKDIAHTIGNSEDKVMSQKGTTDAISCESGKYFEKIEGRNIFDKSAPREPNFVIGSGYVNESANYENYSLPVEIGMSYTFPIYAAFAGSSQYMYVAAYDSNSQYYGQIEGVSDDDRKYLTVTITDANVAYIKVNVGVNTQLIPNIETFMIVEGENYPDEYTPYSAVAYKLKENIDLSNHIDIGSSNNLDGSITLTKREAFVTGKASIGAKTMNINASTAALSTFAGWYIPIMKYNLPKKTIGVNVCLVSNVSEITVAVDLYDTNRTLIKSLALETVTLAKNPYYEGGYSLEHTFECDFDADSIETEAAYIRVYLPNVSASSTERLKMGMLPTQRTDIDSSVYPLRYSTVVEPNKYSSNGSTDFTFIKLIKPALETVDYKEYGLPVLSVEGDIETMTKDRKVTLDYQYAGRKGTCTLKWQGTSSINHPKKNYTIVFDTAFEAKEGWGVQNKYCLKANYIDFTHARNICCAKLWGGVVKSRTPANTTLNALPNAGAIDGFPICVVINGVYQGIYTFNIPKEGWMFGMGLGTKEAILCAESHATRSTFKEEALLDETDWSIEYQSDEFTDDEIKESFNRLVRACINNNGTDLDKYLDWESAIDYYAHCLVTLNFDGVRKNCLMVTYDGAKWFFSAYDMDSTFGMWWDGTKFIGVKTYGVAHCASEHRIFELIKTYKADKLKARYKELVSGALSEETVIETFTNFVGSIPKALLDEEVKIWNQLPSTSVNNVAQIIDFNRRRRAYIDPQIEGL